MNFGQAIEALKVGERVCRQGWNGKNMYLELQAPTKIQSMEVSSLCSQPKVI